MGPEAPGPGPEKPEMSEEEAAKLARLEAELHGTETPAPSPELTAEERKQQEVLLKKLLGESSPNLRKLKGEQKDMQRRPQPPE